MLIFCPVNAGSQNRVRRELKFMQLRISIFLILALVLPAGYGLAETTSFADAARNRCSYVGLKDFTKFTKSTGASNEVVLTSPEITAPIVWDELIVSWNVPKGVHLKMEARAIYPDHATKYYTMS